MELLEGSGKQILTFWFAVLVPAKPGKVEVKL